MVRNSLIYTSWPVMMRLSEKKEEEREKRTVSRLTHITRSLPLSEFLISEQVYVVKITKLKIKKEN